MKIPDTAPKLLDFAREQVEICAYSQGSRAQTCSENLAFYESGSDGKKPSLYNRTGIHIDRTASYLYAPSEVRYSIGFDATDGEPWLTRARLASRYLSREYRRSDADVIFSQGVNVGLIKGCALMKHNWMEEKSFHPGLDPHLVHPEFFGVEREDLQRLEDQQCFLETTYLSKEQVQQQVRGREDENEVLAALEKIGVSTKDSEQRENWLHQMVLGGITPVANNTASGARGQVAVSPYGSSEFSPQLLKNLVRMDELWVVDDEREDYTTLQVIEGLIILEGKYLHRNLTGVKGLHPYSKICADPIPGYFWGRSEVSRVKLLQEFLTERMRDVRRLLKLQLRPPKGFIGFTGITQQKMKAAMTADGFLQEQNPNAKIEDLISHLPQEAFAEISIISEMFDEIAGFKPILMGQGEPGVRAGSHARTLMRTASPKLRERALRIERDAESSAHIAFQLMQAKDAKVFTSEKKESFLLKQMPEDYYVEIDSHSASPVFSDDARELAFALQKAGAVGPVELITLTHPPMEDQLIAAAKERAAAREKLIREHPELLSHPGGKKKVA